VHFPVSGVDCPLWLPPALAFVVALVTAPAGLSGAFLLLPFQMSVLGFVTPGVTPTNLLYNIVAIPGGVYRYIRERRMNWPLTWIVVAGTLPGVFVGAVVRVRYMADPHVVKLFVGLVLVYIAARLFWDLKTGARNPGLKFASGIPADAVVKTTVLSAGKIEFEFLGQWYSYRPATLSALALIVGVIGGIYGVGGGAIIAPYVVAILHLPTYAIAGAALFGTFLTSIAGVAAFEIIGKTSLSGGAAARPDWALGILFGVGGLFGSYCGARLQRYLPERWIKLGLGLLISALAGEYITQFFR
jgi:uncharacterized membrane protein YfcA